MPAAALLLTLGAAAVHALWNVLLAKARDTEAAMAVALVASIVLTAPVAAATWEVDADVLPYLLGSSALELVYFALLATAYERSDLSLVYPVARGLAPLVVLGLGAAALGTGTSAAEAGGVALVALGIVLVRGLPRHADNRGLALAALIAVAVAGCTLLDKRGIEHASPLAYVLLVTVGPCTLYPLWIARRKGRAAIRAEARLPVIAAGAALFVSYALILAALDRAPAAAVAAVRETGVVLVAVFAWLVLKERVGPARFAGAVLVAAGIALVSS